MAVCLLAMSLCACQRHSCRGWRRHSAAGLWLLIQRWCLRSLWPRLVIVTSQYLSILSSFRVLHVSFSASYYYVTASPCTMRHLQSLCLIHDITVHIFASCTGSLLNPEVVLRTVMMTSHVAFFCIRTNIQNTKASEWVWVSAWVSEFVTVTPHIIHILNRRDHGSA